MAADQSLRPALLSGSEGLAYGVAAALGVVYAVLAPLKSFQMLLHPASKVLSSAALLLTAFGYGNRIVFFKGWACFWLLSMALGGLIWAIGLLFGQIYAANGLLGITGPPLWLLLSLAYFGAMALNKAFTAFRKQGVQASHRRMLRLEWDESHMVMPALVDSGNGLFDPVSGLPVIVVSQAEMEGNWGMAMSEWAQRDYVKARIPFATIGGQGEMTGFLPTAIYMWEEGKAPTALCAYVALSPHLSPGLALLPAAFTAN